MRDTTSPFNTFFGFFGFRMLAILGRSEAATGPIERLHDVVR